MAHHRTIHRRAINRFEEGREPPRANNGGMLNWLWLAPLGFILGVAYFYGISW